MMRMRQAVLKALDDAFTDDPTVIMMGEDIAAAGGPFKVTEGLLETPRPASGHRHADLGDGASWARPSAPPSAA